MRMLSVSCGRSFANSLVSTRASSVEGQDGLAPDLADMFGQVARMRPTPYDFELSFILKKNWSSRAVACEPRRPGLAEVELSEVELAEVEHPLEAEGGF